MINKYCQILLLFLSVNIYSQDDMSLPKITPPSPEAYALTKYGDQTINENSGMVTQNISLFNFEAGKLNLPVNILYQGAGVKVDDVPTWVGINWTLKAGGVITRVVKDMPDEKAVTRNLLTNDQVQNYYDNTMDGTSVGQSFKNLILNDQIDNEVDIFNFNFMGYSGSFYLDENKKPRILNSKNQLDIIIDTNFDINSTIKIITENGIEFIFGGETATESTTRRYVVNGSVTPNDSNDGVTGFYLQKIIHPKGGEIIFEYTQELGMEITSTQKIDKRDYIVEICDLTDIIEVPPSMSAFTTISTRVTNPKYLTKIKSPNTNFEINFISDRVDNVNFKRILKKIELKNTSSNSNVKTVDFEYSGINFNNVGASKRFFLNKIIFDKEINNSHLIKNEVYRFEYDNPDGIPARFSTSKDFIGYFNGKNNINLIPDNTLLNPLQAPNMFADRTPNFELAKFGTLKKVYFPTGGHTLYEYEAKKAKKKRYKMFSLFTYRNVVEYLPPNRLYDGIPQITENDSIYGIQNVYEDTTAKIKVTLKATDSQTSIIPQQEKGYLKVYDITNNQNFLLLNELVAMPSPTPDLQGNMTIYKVFNFEVGFFAGHSYKVEFTLFDEGTPNQTPLEANVTIEYLDGYDVLENAGIRIKRITNYTSNDKKDFVKRIYYRPASDLVETLESLPLIEETLYMKTERKIYNKPEVMAGSVPSYVEAYVLYLIISSEQVDYSNTVNNGFYENVTLSHGGDNFENGGLQKTFRKNDDFGVLQIPTKEYPAGRPPTATKRYDLESFKDMSTPNPLSGELVKEEYLIKEGSLIKKQKVIQYEYNIQGIKIVNNLIGFTRAMALFYTLPVTTGNLVSTLDAGVYITPSVRNELSKKIEKTYITPIDLYIEDDSTYAKMIVTTEYKYSPDLIGVPNEVITTTSQGNVKKVKSFYPINSDLPHLNDAPINYYNNYVALKNKHILSQPVQVETYLENELISKTRTLYKKWDIYSTSIYPEIIQASKGNTTLEDRIVFHEYSGSNPKIVSYKDGSKTKYIYNSDNKVTAKIENYVVGAGGEIDENNSSGYSPCANLNVNTNVTTLYTYDPITKLLTEVKDPNCKSTFYIYDEFHRLKQIKDNQNKVIKEFDTNYRPFQY